MVDILVVDDDPNNQLIMKYTLRKAGFNVRIAQNGQIALDMLAKALADLAIVDVAMPVMDGLSLLRCLRADERFHSIPVIILTASGDDRESILAQEGGAQAFLTKPSSSRTLIDTVQKILNGK